MKPNADSVTPAIKYPAVGKDLKGPPSPGPVKASHTATTAKDPQPSGMRNPQPIARKGTTTKGGKL